MVFKMAAIRPRSGWMPLRVLAALCIGWWIALSLSPMRGKAQESPACQSLVPPNTPSEDRFEYAKADVKTIKDCENWDGLEAIDRSNPSLIWDPTGKRVLMVTWVEKKPSGKMIITPGSSNRPGTGYWATTVPTIRSMLQREIYKLTTRSLSSNPVEHPIKHELKVVERTKQYLGLKPDSHYNYFMEFWASPKDLIRPCEDQEVTDHHCISRERPRDFSDDSYPFTGLGYSYDWGNEDTEVGAAEFVVRPETEIQVFQVIDNRQYLLCDKEELFPPLNVTVLRKCL